MIAGTLLCPQGQAWVSVVTRRSTHTLASVFPRWPCRSQTCSPRHFAKFIDCEHLAGVIGMFSFDPVLESRYGVHKIRGFVAIHFISTRATRYRARHALWLESMPTLLDFLLKLLFSEHVSSVSLCHLSSLPHLSAGDEMFPQAIAGAAYSPSISLQSGGAVENPPFGLKECGEQQGQSVRPHSVSACPAWAGIAGCVGCLLL
jgi:hypothetical protein